ncbi:MAG: YciI family protein [Paracoccaceae bacterium]
MFKKDGVMLAGEPRHGTDQATSVRFRDGKTETMDGPFAETKEQLGGFYIFDCEDLDAAIKYAAMIPTSRFGTIEVRPVMDLSKML